MRVFNGPGDGKTGSVGYRMENKKDTSADIYLYDIIGDSWEGTTAKQFATDLKALGELKDLNIFINSEGGSVFDGVAIYNVLRRHKARKNVQIDGLAASIASVVAMAGDTIQIAHNGMVMIHDPWAMAFIRGTAADFKRMGDNISNSLTKIREAILATYVERTNGTEKQISDWMTEETWFTAEEAIANGFADSMTEHVVDVAALANKDLSNYKKVPDFIKNARTAAQTESTVVKFITVEETADKFAAIAERGKRLANLQL